MDVSSSNFGVQSLGREKWRISPGTSTNISPPRGGAVVIYAAGMSTPHSSCEENTKLQFKPCGDKSYAEKYEEKATTFFCQLMRRHSYLTGIRLVRIS